MARPHQRFIFHFAAISCSWLNTVEGFFAKFAKRRLKRGIFRSVVDLKAASTACLGGELTDRKRKFPR